MGSTRHPEAYRPRGSRVCAHVLLRGWGTWYHLVRGCTGWGAAGAGNLWEALPESDQAEATGSEAAPGGKPAAPGSFLPDTEHEVPQLASSGFQGSWQEKPRSMPGAPAAPRRPVAGVLTPHWPISATGRRSVQPVQGSRWPSKMHSDALRGLTLPDWCPPDSSCQDGVPGCPHLCKHSHCHPKGTCPEGSSVLELTPCRVTTIEWPA